MSEYDDWLPPLVEISDYDGDWKKYLQALYEVFSHDFVDNMPQFEERPVQNKWHPLIDGKEYTFWHCISTGSVEKDRIPDFNKCKRIRWPRPVIEAVVNGRVRYWRNERRNKRRGKEKRVVIALEDFSYVVILAERGKGYFLLWTQYPVQQEHQRRKLEGEWRKAQKS